LKDFPDKNAILELTAITEKNISFAEHFSNIIMARLTNEQTHACYKLPLFYVIDAIMKHVGGPFANLFSIKFSESYMQTLFDLNQIDRKKLMFLLDTWDERSFMTFDLIRKMKAVLGAPANKPTPVSAQPQAMPLSTPTVPAPVFARPAVAKPLPVPAPVAKFQPVSHQQAPQVAPQRDFRIPPSATFETSTTSGMFADLVQNEMVTMLNQMYAEMGVKNPMSLEELHQKNPSLYAQIQHKAEESAELIMSKRQSTSSPVQRHPAAASQYSQYPAPSPTQYADVTGHKRGPAYQGAAQGQYPHQRPYNAQTNYNDSYNDNYYHQSNYPQTQYHQYKSRYNTTQPSNDHRYPAHSTANSNTNMSRDRSTNATASNLGSEIHSAVTPSEEHLHEEILSKYASDYFVNGFLCEVPVVIDVARVQALRDVLQSHYISSPSGSEQANNTSPSKLPAGFEAAAAGVTKRLSMYLNDIQVPPKLPQILFGPLPLRPIYAPSAEAVEEQNSKNKARDAAAAVKPATKLPVPPFRPEELGRNPETAIAALYHNKPHQFHEDGLRFATLALLTQHTDKFIAHKKVLQKKGTVREYREWYCSTAQWITDFGALNVGGSSAGSAGGNISAGNPSAMATQNAPSSSSTDSEEYVVPADEYFTRCPVSRETFECFWDDQEGEMLYRNAVKVLITESADPALYALAQPISWVDNANSATAVRYLIVHKVLVLDAWLSAGRAVPLQDAVIRYKAVLNATSGGGVSGAEKAELLLQAVGQDDDEEDIFVLLEFK